MKKVGDWDAALKHMEGMADRFEQAMQTGLKQVGQHVRGEIVKGITQQAPGGQPFAPLSALTIERKGSSKALIDNGDLVGSITYELVDDDKVFVGLLRTAKGKGGQPLVNIGRVHEEGCLIPVTQKMRGWFLYNFGVKLRPETTHIRIPARPFLKPVLEAEADNVAKIFQDKVSGVFKV